MADSLTQVEELKADTSAPASLHSPTGDAFSAHQPSPASSGGPPLDGTQTFPPPHRSSSIALNPRSCVTCRKRKVRCDKQQPCSNCVRARIPCQFPAPGRAPRRPRKPPDGELLARLRKLEGVVKSLGATPDDENILPSPLATENGTVHRPDSASPLVENGVENANRLRNASLDNNFGRLVLDEGKSRYVNNSFWANLSNEVEDIKTILHDESDEEIESPTPGVSPHDSPDQSQAYMFHHSSPAAERSLPHPPPHIIQLYWDKYEENVDPLVKMLHLPSVRAIFQSIKQDTTSIPRHHEPLVFAIYYGAVTSLTGEEAQTYIGEPKAPLQARYRRYVECALAKEHFLSTEEICVLQALILFLLSLRGNEHPRVLWSLTGVVVRIAMTMGLHREPSLFDLSLYCVEIRRRLWWQVCNLDSRLSEDHGSDPGILEHSFDTQYPLNIDDQDFQPDMPITVQGKQGISDMTFSLIRFEVSNTFRRLSYCPPHAGSFKDGRLQEVTIKDKEQWIEDCHRSLEEKYLRHCDMTIPMHWVIGTVARLIMAKMWLLIYQPYQRLDGGASLPQETRDRLFVTSLESIEYALLLETEVRTVKWGWLFKSYSQWHALAFLLSELCHRTKGPTVQRAWVAVEETINEMRSRVAPGRRDVIWRPLGRLMAKARAARDGELAHDTMAQTSNPWTRTNGNHTGWDPQTAACAKAFGQGSGYEKAMSFDSTPASHHSGDTKSTSSSTQAASSNGTSITSHPAAPTGTPHPPTSLTGAPITSGLRPPNFTNSHYDPSWTMNANGTQPSQSTSTPASDFAPSPFFANQPPVQPPAWPATASNTDTALLNDFFMGEGLQNPNYMRSGLTPAPMNGLPAISKDLGTLGDATYPRENVNRHVNGHTNGVNGAFNGEAENPMVSGADVQWEDWDDMVKEFEVETQGPGFGPFPTSAGVFGKRPRPGVGDMWF